MTYLGLALVGIYIWIVGNRIAAAIERLAAALESRR